MKTFEFTDGEIAAILNAIYPRYDELEKLPTKNHLTNASIRNEFNDLKSACEKLEN